MKTRNLSRIIGTDESITVEWKPSLSQINEIIESVAGFATTEGGTIFVGVSKKGIPVGISIGAKTIEDLANRIAQHTDPRMHPRIVVLKIQEKEIIAIQVRESHEKPVCANGKPYIRVGKSTRQMSRDEYECHIIDKHKDRIRFDSQICKGATLKRIDRSLLKEFVRRAKMERGLDLNEAASAKDTLMRLKLLKNGRLTNAAILLFDAPHDFYLQCEVKCIRFKGLDVTGEMLDLKPIVGSIIHQLRDAEKFIFDHISLSAWIESGKLERQEKWEYPPKAIREALANAIAHRDYWSTGKVQVRIFDDRMEIWNPGRLPEGWTAETLTRKHDSLPPNPLIAKQFFWYKYIEDVGTGTNKIIQLCRDWDLPDPIFEYTGTSIVVTLRKAPVAAEKATVREAIRKGGQKSGQISGQKEWSELSDKQKAILELISKRPTVSRRELSKAVGINPSAIQRHLQIMKKRGFLRRVGPDRGGHWEVTKQR